MFRKLLHYAGKYKVPAILSPLAIVFEVLIEVAIPFMMSIIIDCGIGGQPLTEKTGIVVDILLKLGLGKYEDGTLQESYSGARIHEPCDHEYKTTACAVFVEPHKLVLRCDVVDWYFGNLTATFGFKGDACGFRMVKNAEDFLRDYFGWGEGRAEGVNV